MYKPKAPVALLLNVDTDRPLQTQLFDQLRAMILDGQLKSGSALPATRNLSEDLGISRKTVVNAYDRLLLEGYIESKPSIGTFVSEAIPDEGILAGGTKAEAGDRKYGAPAHEPAVLATARRHQAFGVKVPPAAVSNTPDACIDFRPASFDPALFPERAWRRAYSRQCGLTELHAQSKDRQGFYPLRRAIAEHLGPSRGIVTSADHVVLTAGLDQARTLLSDLLLGPSPYTNSIAIVEAPGSLSLSRHVKSAGGTVLPIPVDQHGLRTSELPAAGEMRSHNGRGLVYVSPRQSVPLGTGLILQRQIELLDWAQQAQLMVIEDAGESDFVFHNAPQTALKGLDQHDTVIYFGGFEHVVGPLIPLAYLILPHDLVETATMLLEQYGTPEHNLTECAMAEFMESGAYDSQLRKLKKQASEKRALLKEGLSPLFGSLDLIGEDGGLQLALRLPNGFGSAEILADRALREVGVKLYSACLKAAEVPERRNPTGNNTKSAPQGEVLIFGYGGLLPHEIKEGACRLRPLIERHQKRKAQKKTARITPGKHKKSNSLLHKQKNAHSQHKTTRLNASDLGDGKAVNGGIR